tara:strand:+ start:858 stop:2186 length:1329 start_codon:yes stop_codon:yes gene_type:complete
MGLLDNQTPQAYYNGNDYGDYQFVSLADIINQFMFVYVGEDKIISKASRTDVAFHAQRALAELSFDTLKSCKAQEITVPASLQMILPQDYINYTKVSWVDSAGVKHLLYPASKTSNPTNPLQDSDGLFKLQATAKLGVTSSVELDAEYKDILVGMVVTSQLIPAGTVVGAISNTGGITFITLEDSLGGAVLPTHIRTGVTLNFQNADSSLILPQKESHIVENLSWDLSGDYKIIGTASELTDIEVGMLVSHDNFPVGTVVTSVYQTTITVDQLPDTAVTSGGEILFISPDIKDSNTWANYKSGTPSENQDDYQDDTYWPMDGSRYGLDPQHAQANGSFYIDCISGKIHFSSNISGKTVILDYISDSLGTDDEMQVHKFAEEAMYKWIAHAVLSGKSNIPEYQVNRFKKERFAAIRTAKLRLSSLKLEELTQILRGKSKWIKH